jgi:putative selenate reductase
MEVPVLACLGGGLAVTGRTAFEVTQSRQIIHLADLCNDCGNCATFCVHTGEPYREKPRLFLRRDDFALQNDNAYFFESETAGWTIRKRAGGRESRLKSVQGAGEIAYENDLVRTEFSNAGFTVKAIELKRPFPGEITLTEAAEMYVIARGLAASLAFLPHP